MGAEVHFVRGSETSPPAVVDPRRSGAVIGLVGACVFVFSYTDGWGDPASVVMRTLTGTLVLLTFLFLYIRPRFLGPFQPPRAGPLVVYVLCVLGELGLIALGTTWLDGAGNGGLRPALIAAVVGLHFLPFGWVFAERMFVILGAALMALGTAGLLLGTPGTAAAAAVASGAVMASVLLAYSLGAFAPRSEKEHASGPEDSRSSR